MKKKMLIRTSIISLLLSGGLALPRPLSAGSFRFVIYRVQPDSVFQIAVGNRRFQCAPLRRGMVAGTLLRRHRFKPLLFTRAASAKTALQRATGAARNLFNIRLKKLNRRQKRFNAACEQTHSSSSSSSSSFAASPTSPQTIGQSALLEDDSESWYSIWVNRAPGDGITSSLNPPRFRWPFSPSYADGCGLNENECNSEQSSYYRNNFKYTLQIAADPAFEDLLVNIPNIYNVNFYNFLSPLDTSVNKTFYWRIGYLNVHPANVHFGQFTWSDVWRFTMAEDAVLWDRSMFSPENIQRITTATRPHPRMYLKDDLIAQVKAHINEPLYASQLHQLTAIMGAADAVIASDWYKVMLQWPDADRPTQEEISQSSSLPCSQTNFILPCNYTLPWGSRAIAEALVHVAFAYRWTGDSKYLGVIERFIKIARYGRGSSFGPEGFGSNCCGINSEYWLGLLFDWLYNEMTEQQRALGQHSLEWRMRALLCVSMHKTSWL